MSDSMEVVHRLEREMADRASAVEKVDIFKAQFNQAIKAFMAADEAVRSLNDHDSIVDTQIANAIDEHLRAIDRLCVSASTVVSVRSIRLRSTSLPHGHGSKVEEGRIRSSSRTIGVRPDTSVRPFLPGFCNS